MHRPNNKVITGIICAVVAAIGFSVKSIFIKLAFTYGVDSVTLLALRMAFALPFFIGMLVLSKLGLNKLWSDTLGSNKSNNQKSLSQQEWCIIFGLSTAYYLFNYLDFLGLQTISAGLERMIQFLYPTMTILLSAWFYKRTLSQKTKLAMLLSYAGITLVFFDQASATTQQTGIGLGAALVFISAVCYAVYLVGAGHVVERIGTTRFTAYVMILASLASLTQFGLSHPITALQQPVAVYQLAIAMALFCTVLPVFMLTIGMRLIGSANTSLMGSAGPIFTLYLAHIFLGESITPTQLLGSLLVLLGVILISKESQQAPA